MPNTPSCDIPKEAPLPEVVNFTLAVMFNNSFLLPLFVLTLITKPLLSVTHNESFKPITIANGCLNRPAGVEGFTTLLDANTSPGPWQNKLVAENNKALTAMIDRVVFIVASLKKTANPTKNDLGDRTYRVKGTSKQG